MAKGKYNPKKRFEETGYESAVMYGKSLYTVEKTGKSFSRTSGTGKSAKTTKYVEVKLGGKKITISENLLNASLKQLRTTVTKMGNETISKKKGVEQLRKIKDMMRNNSETYKVDKFFFNIVKDSGIGKYFEKSAFKGHLSAEELQKIKELSKELSKLSPQEKVDFYHQNKAFFDDLTDHYHKARMEGDRLSVTAEEYSYENLMITVENLLTKLKDFKS